MIMANVQNTSEPQRMMTSGGYDSAAIPVRAVVAAIIFLLVLCVAVGSLYQKHKRKRNRENVSAEDMRRKRLALFQDRQVCVCVCETDGR